ncbi:MAG TPA: lysophospholipid acyltransferase family protein [Polyangia bacterium]|jgi:1-acyl-sn-glycerol-3-phosphate acyltransferase
MIPPAAASNLRAALAAVYAAMRAGYDASTPRPETAPDHGYDPRFLDEIGPALEFLFSKYFRVDLRGLANVPASGPAVLVANHSGGIPYDGALLIHGIYRRHPAHRRLRPLVASFAFRSPWMSHVVARIGGVRAASSTARELLQAGELVGVFPEGLRGVGKLFRDRYRLHRFGRGGFVRLAMENGVPIIPVAIVGAEEIHPVLAKLTALAEPLGLPYIPITPTFPLLGPLGLLPLPSKWTIQIGEPIFVSQKADSHATIVETAEQVRGLIDDMISTILTHRRSVFFG